jgi:hypothetical protein
MFYKALWIERERTWRFQFNIKVSGKRCTQCRQAEVYGLKNVWMADVVQAGNFFGAEIASANSNLVNRIADDRSQRSNINNLANQVVTDLDEL